VKFRKKKKKRKKKSTDERRVYKPATIAPMTNGDKTLHKTLTSKVIRRICKIIKFEKSDERNSITERTKYCASLPQV
jgi:hypothetical protein